MPRYEPVSFMLKATVWNGFVENDPINDPIKLTETEEKILKLLKEDSSLSRFKIAEVMNISESTVKRVLNSLQMKEIIKRVGSNKTGHWRIMK